MKLIDAPVKLTGGTLSNTQGPSRGTMAQKILTAHGATHIKFDALISHDITYVGIIQTARASGLERFPIPYAFTNCHNSLCAVGGTINADDHAFGLSAAKKYGGIYVPPNLAVIHQYAREQMAFCGGMILGSDSHTRYGALGTLAIGEGGGELVKQLLGNTYDLPALPETVLVYLKGKPRHGVGPHDVALTLCRDTFGNGFVKNRILEFAGEGVGNLSMDFRIGIDVMTTETACLSSIWVTDEKTEKYYETHGRKDKYQKLAPEDGAVYDRAIVLDLDEIEPMIALPFHPSNAFTIRELNENPQQVLQKAEEAASLHGELVRLYDGKGVKASQFLVAGCAGGTYENLLNVAEILGDQNAGNMSVYPSSIPVEAALIRSGTIGDLLQTGAVIKPCFCGPCFGAGDVPANGTLSIRHSTRNFPNREGSKPGENQSAFVALMDARSIAATALNGGYITGADSIPYTDRAGDEYAFDPSAYQKRVYNGAGKPDPRAQLVLGPNITDWPAFKGLEDDLEFTVASVLTDAVTTTDELIPSGETSSYRSNPVRLSEFALSRRDPGYVSRSKALRDSGKYSAVAAHCPGDGSAREQAASCQRVLGGIANIAVSYATKRYRANLINWGIVPFICPDALSLCVGDRVVVKGFRDALLSGNTAFEGIVNGERTIALELPAMTPTERENLVNGCLINTYAERRKQNG